MTRITRRDFGIAYLAAAAAGGTAAGEKHGLAVLGKVAPRNSAAIAASPLSVGFEIGLWHGEVGAASQPGGAGGRANYAWTETRQAKWLLRRFLSDLRMEIELVSYFHTVDLVSYVASEGPTGKTNYKGLLRGTDYSPKPAYFAYQCLCALFDSETARAELPMEFARSPIAGEIVSAGFKRKGKAMYAYWHPPGAEMERPDETIDLCVPIRPGAQLSAPVLVDPLSATIYRVERCDKRGDRWQIPAAPLADHPLILTDRSVVLPS